VVGLRSLVSFLGSSLVGVETLEGEFHLLGGRGVHSLGCCSVRRALVLGPFPCLCTGGVSSSKSLFLFRS
jgi:hypothetical protein